MKPFETTGFICLAIITLYQIDVQNRYHSHQKPVTLCPKHSGYAQRCPQAEGAGHRGPI
nr:MAG TPA: hypothetical protein [Caudoviricetes sp.]